MTRPVLAVPRPTRRYDLDRDRRLGSGLLGKRSQVIFGLHREQPGDRRRVEGEVDPVPGPDLDHLAV
jgi:hypothetical protein